MRYLLALMAVLSLTVAVAADNSREPPGEDDAANEALPITAIDFSTRRMFATDQDYGDYVQKTLQVGWRVRACADYQSVKQGMMGTYYGTKPGGTPPCSVVWDKNINSSSSLLPNVPPDKARHVYWVYWHQVEILGPKR